MQTNSQFSAISIPIWLPILMAVFIAARSIAYFVDRSQTRETVGINWLEPSAMDLKGTRAATKLVLYEFDSEINDFSKSIDKSMLLRNGVVKLANEQFVPVRVMEKKSKQGTDQDDLTSQLRQKFRVDAYPTFLVTLPDGKEIDRYPFPFSARSLIAFLEHSQKIATYNLGLELLASAKYQLSANAFEDWLKHTQTRKNAMMNAALYCSLCYYMLGQNQKANMILESAIAKYQCATRWPEPIADFMLGKITSEALLKMCDEAEYKQSAQARAHYFIGMTKLKEGNIAASKEDFVFAKTNSDETSETSYLIDKQLYLGDNKRNVEENQRL